MILTDLSRRLLVLPVLCLALIGVTACQTTTESGTSHGTTSVAAPTPSSPPTVAVASSDKVEFRAVLESVPGAPPASVIGRPSADPQVVAAAKQTRQSADRAAQQQALAVLDCAAPDPLRGQVEPTLPLVTCGADGSKLLLDATFLTGREISIATVEQDTQSDGFVINISFLSSGGKTWGDFTTTHVGQQVSLVLQGDAFFTTTIQEPVVGGSTRISGLAQQKAEQLVYQISGKSSGAYCLDTDLKDALEKALGPVPIQQIGRVPSMAQENHNDGGPSVDKLSLEWVINSAETGAGRLRNAQTDLVTILSTIKACAVLLGTVELTGIYAQDPSQGSKGVPAVTASYPAAALSQVSPSMDPGRVLGMAAVAQVPAEWR